MILELKKLFGNIFEAALIQEIANVGSVKDVPLGFYDDCSRGKDQGNSFDDLWSRKNFEGE